jgi:hypothetical protein
MCANAISFSLALCSLIIPATSKGAYNTQTIRSIDFKNFSFPWDEGGTTPLSWDGSPWYWFKSIPASKIPLVNGMHHFYETGQSQFERERTPYLCISAVTYGKLDGIEAELATVTLNYSTGGTQNWDYLYVYRLVRGSPQAIAILESGSRAYGGLYRTEFQNGRLVLDFADPDRQVGDCCSEGYIRTHYRWKNGAFVEEGPRERGDIDLTPK